MELEEYIQYHESKLHEQPGFSYNTYLCTIPQDFRRVGLHWHEQMEIIYIKKGSGTVTVNTQPYSVAAGAIVPILPGELHAIEGDPGVRMEYENIIFSLSILDSTEESDWCRAHVIRALQNGTLLFERPICPGTAFHDEASHALDAADRASETRAPGFSLLVKSSLFLFLHALYSHKLRQVERVISAHQEVLKRIILYVKQHFAEDIQIADAAAAVEYSPSHFMRLFKQETGRTFIEYLTSYRLDYASYLLKESTDSIGAIASSCGFDNFSYFIRLFRKHYGVSPSEYRKGEFSKIVAN